MTLREVTRTVISLVEDTSGCPVAVSEDVSLKTLAASRIARGANRFHSISFNPSTVKEPDYLICYQCGFILRLFGVSESDRVDLAGTAEGRQTVQRLLTAPDGPGKQLKLSPESISGLRDQLFDGLMLQLRSIPVGFRVDSWILRDYRNMPPPKLCAVRKRGIEKYSHNRLVGFLSRYSRRRTDLKPFCLPAISPEDRPPSD